MNRGLKTFLLWGVLLGIVLLALLNRERESPAHQVWGEEPVQMIDSGRIRSYSLQGRDVLLVTTAGVRLAVSPPASAEVLRHIAHAHVPYLPETDRSDLGSVLLWLLVVVGVVAAVIYFLRKMRGAPLNNIFELRKTKARPIENADKAQFADIGGNHQAVELLMDIVEFLRAPQRWKAAGLRIPRGVLVVGPPGTGKTLLARAVAGETKSAFFYTSAAEFVEMFVGVGSARVRDTFQKAVAAQPAILFIDELDAIGRRRGSGTGTIHEEREQTLNQLLVLMDGMEQHKNLFVMAATNRPDVLDPALLRSGRFDRVLRLKTPTRDERLEILKVHTRHKTLTSPVSLESIAEQADGYTGADLEALTNAAGLIAVRRTRDDANGQPGSISLTTEDFQQAFEQMPQSNRLFDRLDSVLVESASQFAEPVGKAHVRVTLNSGSVVEGEVLWMNATHFKLRLTDDTEVIVAKDAAAQMVALEGTESAPQADFIPDRWSGRSLDVG